MAHTVDEQPCEEDAEQGQNQQVPAEPEGEQCQTPITPCPEEGSPENVLISDLSLRGITYVPYVPSKDCTDLNDIPLVCFTGPVGNGHVSYDVPPASKEKLLQMAMEEKRFETQENSDSDSDNVAPQPTWVLCAAITVLLLANTLNYMDRYTIAGESWVLEWETLTWCAECMCTCHSPICMRAITSKLVNTAFLDNVVYN